MDRQELFDTLTVRVSDVVARRDVFRWLGRFVLAMFLFGIVPWRTQQAEASKLIKGCRLPGQRCRRNKRCCSRKCGGNHRCRCVNKGGKPNVKTPLGVVPVKVLCCSNKLNKIKGTCK